MAEYNLGAFVVIFEKKGRVLLSHRGDMDLWNLPGGVVESGEFPDEAAILLCGGVRLQACEGLLGGCTVSWRDQLHWNDCQDDLFDNRHWMQP